MKFRLLMALTMVSLLGINAFAQNNSKAIKDATKTANEASKVINEIMRAEDKSIPRDLLRKAQAVVVFPGAIKGAFIVGAQGGKGLAIRRTGRGWSAPAFLNMAGGSVGFQIGGSKTDYILLIMNDEGLRGLLADKFEVGGEGSVAAGPVGRTAAASTNATLDAGILTYSRSKGLFAGLSLKGVVISNDDDVNGPIYNKTAKVILGQPAVAASAAPASLQGFGSTVATYAR
jgi:lipid-binding SYLF domain-containing protein